MHQAALKYNPPLLRQAVVGFWWRATGFRFFIALAAVAFGLVASVREGDASWVTGVLGGVLIAGILFPLALFAVHYRNTFQKLKAMGSPQATLEASDSALSLSSGAGSASIPWTAITEIWQLKGCWLLLLSRSQFFTLPLADLTPALKDFILAKVRASGGKVG